VATPTHLPREISFGRRLSSSILAKSDDYVSIGKCVEPEGSSCNVVQSDAAKSTNMTQYCRRMTQPRGAMTQSEPDNLRQMTVVTEMTQLLVHRSANDSATTILSFYRGRAHRVWSTAENEMPEEAELCARVPDYFVDSAVLFVCARRRGRGKARKHGQPRRVALVALVALFPAHPKRSFNVPYLSPCQVGDRHQWPEPSPKCQPSRHSGDVPTRR